MSVSLRRKCWVTRISVKAFRGITLDERFHLRSEVKDVAKETHFLVLVKEPKKGHWQKHGRFKFLLAEEATFQLANQLKCGSKMRKRRPLSPLLIPPNSCLHLFVLFFYILAELIPHDADSVSHVSVTFSSTFIADFTWLGSLRFFLQ